MPFGEFVVARRLLSEPIVPAPEQFVLDVPHGILVGDRAVVTEPDHYLITDSMHPRHMCDIFFDAERRTFENVRLESKDNTFAFSASAYPHVEIAEEVVILTAMEHNNYGAFLLRALPKILSIRKLGIRCRPIAPIAKPWQRRIFSAFGEPMDDAIIYDSRRTYVAKRIILPSMRLSEFFLDDESRSLFLSMSKQMQNTDEATRRPEKIYVSRISAGEKNPDHRRCTNEWALAAALQAIGFHIFEPENHTFEEQVRTFASVRFVVGPGGAGMFNTVFCKRGTKVISIEPQPNWVVMHASMFASCEHEYALIIGGSDAADPAVQKRWVADIECVLNRVKIMDG